MEKYVEKINLLMAAKALDGDILTEIIKEKDIDLNAKGEYGRTALHWFSSGGCDDSVDLLLKKGADPNVLDENGLTPLHWASGKGYFGIVKNLISAGADVNIRCEYKGNSPLDWALLLDKRLIAMTLVQAGADLYARNPMNGFVTAYSIPSERLKKIEDNLSFMNVFPQKRKSYISSGLKQIKDITSQVLGVK